MVLLNITPALRAAIEQYQTLRGSEASVTDLKLDESIEHHEIIDVSRYLVQHAKDNHLPAEQWRLDILLKGASIYQAPPPPKPKQTEEYKALMARLRKQEEQRQYERMINPPPPEMLQQQPRGGVTLHQQMVEEPDEVTYQDVNRQVILIINILVSIIACSIAIWIIARRWSVPQRLGLSFSGSTVVALAEVAIYMGYIRRIKEAKNLEARKVEKKEIVDTWIIDGKSTSSSLNDRDSMRHRKGKNR